MLVFESEVISFLDSPADLTVENKEISTFIFISFGLRLFMSLKPDVVFLIESPISLFELFGSHILLIPVLI